MFDFTAESISSCAKPRSDQTATSTADEDMHVVCKQVIDKTLRANCGVGTRRVLSTHAAITWLATRSRIDAVHGVTQLLVLDNHLLRALGAACLPNAYYNAYKLTL